MEELLSTFIRTHSGWVYVGIFVGGIFEGPLLTIVCGFWAAQDILNPYIVYPLVTLGDMIGDVCIYLMGRAFSSWVQKVTDNTFTSTLVEWFKSLLKISPQSLKVLEDAFRKHSLKMICFAKLGRAGAVLGLAFAGAMRFPYIRFALCCTPISLGQSVVLLLLGMLVGEYQETFLYLQWYGYVMSMATLAVLFLGWRWVIKKAQASVQGKEL